MQYLVSMLLLGSQPENHNQLGDFSFQRKNQNDLNTVQATHNGNPRSQIQLNQLRPLVTDWFCVATNKQASPLPILSLFEDVTLRAE